VLYEALGGGTKIYRALVEPLPIPRKPLLKVSHEQGQQQLARFAAAHTAPTVHAMAPANAVLTSRLRIRASLVCDNGQLLNHCSQRPRGGLFMSDLREYLPRRGLGVFLGSALSALSLTIRNRGVFYLPGNYFTRLSAILKSTPWSFYAERST
jgi:hypothetical protein